MINTLSYQENYWVGPDGKHVHSHSDLPDNCTDIVYLLQFESGRKYIGKKSVRSIRKKKPTKTQLAIRKNYSRKELTNLPFIKYTGSSKENENEVVIAKYILYYCSNKRTATYLEMAEMVLREVLFTDEYTNKNISGRFYDNSLDGLIEEF